MEIYVEQMEAITELLRMLNAWEEKHGAEILIKNKIEIRYGQADELEPPYGYLVDEIGGTWAFQPYQAPTAAKVLDNWAKSLPAEEVE